MGRLIRKATAGSGKKLSLELGGKSPFVVFDDADLDSVVEGVVDAIWFNQGQVCCAGSRLLVQEGVAERLYRQARAPAWRRCAWATRSTRRWTSAPSSRRCSCEQIERLVRQGEEEGAKLWQPSWSCPREGWFFPPTLFTDVAPAATIAQVEIFGPVLVAMTFRTPAEAVELANNTRYGLAASVWTENINLALDVARQDQGRHGLDQQHQPVRRRLRLRRLPRERLRPRGRAGRAVGVRAAARGRRRPRQTRQITDAKDTRATQNGQGRQTDDQASTAAPAGLPPIDRTPKLYIGGKQARPGRGLQPPDLDADGRLIGEVGEGNRKDIRNAVEAARKAAPGWAKTHGAQPGADPLLHRREPRRPRAMNSPAGSMR